MSRRCRLVILQFFFGLLERGDSLVCEKVDEFIISRFQRDVDRRHVFFVSEPHLCKVLIRPKKNRRITSPQCDFYRYLGSATQKHGYQHLVIG